MRRVYTLCENSALLFLCGKRYLHHAIEKGLMTCNDVHADLGEIISGKKPGRNSAEQVIVFDSTGMALQDVASAAVVYEKALGKNIGRMITFLS